MPNEIDVKGLRELDWNAVGNAVLYVSQYHTAQASREHAKKLSWELREALAALPALLDEIERLRKAIHPVPLNQAVFDASVEWAKRAKAAETELSALKAKMEKVRDKALEWQAGPNVDYDWCGGRILAILDGKEG